MYFSLEIVQIVIYLYKYMDIHIYIYIYIYIYIHIYIHGWTNELRLITQGWVEELMY
jgi:hypothetical protein